MNSKPLLFAPESSALAFDREARDAEPAASANDTEAPPVTMTSAEMDSSTSASLSQNTTSTTLLSTVIPKGPSTVHTNEDGGGDTAGIVAAVVIPVVLVAVFIAIVVWYLRRKGKFRHKSGACFEPIRKRRGSTTDSRRGLEDELDPDKPADLHDDHPGDKGQEDQDMFTIDEFEDDADRRDEYYYDEVFGRSEFEDEVTKNSVRQLYSTADEQKEEELLDLDFETLGIKIGDSPKNSSTRHINF